MRVLMVANTLPPRDLSGAGEQVLQLAWALRQRGHQVEVLGRGGAGARGPKLLFALAVLWPALRAIRGHRPEVVQLHESDAGLLAVILRLLRRWLPPFTLISLLQVSYRREGRAVRRLIDRDSGRVVARPVASELLFRWLRVPLQTLLGRWTARLSDLVLAPSSRTAEEIRQDYSVSTVEVLPNVTGAPLSGDPAAGRPSVVGEAVRRDGLLFVGRFRIRKGIELLLEAFAALAESLPDARLRLAGEGERAALVARRVRHLGLSERVELLGRRTAPEVGELLGRAQALVVPSTYEGMPLVILEAMRLETPVIASRVSGIPETVIAGESGWLVDAESVGQLATAMAEVLSHREEASRRGRAGRRRLEERYRPRHAAQRWLELIADRREEARP